ncbi:hypothetical protein CROQUDRAFT_714755 [Cronartium quercuum f. sp. fusiforme G11]|uniref:Uncharacterized protein n=1 Tax=Cronartium quercuum f. sp. fusiforme G11 TaxID=708437 RepID=A0A9P6NJA2_9BASI|nr:hypothetical protein CROQUDRAFT_714755 [Cronartium quercuum f. sp. fusiforme G11]
MHTAAQSTQLSLTAFAFGFLQFIICFQTFAQQAAAFTGLNIFGGINIFQILISDFIRILFQLLTFIQQRYTFQAFFSQFGPQWLSFSNALASFAQALSAIGMDLRAILASSGVAASLFERFHLTGPYQLFSGLPRFDHGFQGSVSNAPVPGFLLMVLGGRLTGPGIGGAMPQQFIISSPRTPTTDPYFSRDVDPNPEDPLGSLTNPLLGDGGHEGVLGIRPLTDKIGQSPLAPLGTSLIDGLSSLHQ